MIDNTMSFVEGLGASFTFTQSYNKKKEIEQGGNHYLASPCLAGEVAGLGMLVSRIAEGIFESGFLKGTINFLCSAIPIATIPFALVAAAIKNGEYAAKRKGLEDWLEYSKNNNEIFGGLASLGHKVIQLFPEELSDNTKQIIETVYNHADKILLVAMVVGSVALLSIGEFAFAIACLSNLGYNAIDRAGWVPREISLYVEAYLPYLSLVGNIIGGTLIIRVISAVLLINAINPLKWFIIEKIDSVVRNVFEFNSPSLVECNAKWEDNKQFSNDEIWRILKADSIQFEIDPAHCTKSIIDESLPTDKDFGQFLTLFDKEDWTTEYHVIKNMLIDDDKFQEYIVEKFITLKNIGDEAARRDELISEFDTYMLHLAQQEFPEEENQTKEKFAVKWVRDQLVEFDKVVTDKKRVEGMQSDLADAMENLAIILPYLKSSKETQSVIFKDNLLKIAIEGGDYCARGIKRMAQELVVGTLYKDDAFEMSLKQKLLDSRTACVQASYKKLMDAMIPINALSEDVHGYDVYRLILSVGFLPLTKSDNFNYGIFDLLVSLQYDRLFKQLPENDYSLFPSNKGLRETLLDDYQSRLKGVAFEMGQVHVINHVRKKINENTQLTDKEREAIEEYITNPPKALSPEKYNRQIQQLMFAMLGILKLDEDDDSDSDSM